MAGTAKKTNETLWTTVKRKVTKAAKGGKPGQWSARKAQLAVQAYKKEGGGYVGAKSPDNHLKQWEREDWGTKSGAKSKDTGERYLPREARAALSKSEYASTTRKKRADSAKGRQFSKQPESVARKTLKYRTSDGARAGETRTELYARAAKAGIAGRSRMTKAELKKALAK